MQLLFAQDPLTVWRHDADHQQKELEEEEARFQRDHFDRSSNEFTSVTQAKLVQSMRKSCLYDAALLQCINTVGSFMLLLILDCISAAHLYRDFEDYI